MLPEYVRTHPQISYDGAALVLKAAIAKAIEIGVPQNISIVDSGGNLVAFARMDGAKFLAQHSSFSKAQSAASLGMATGQLPAQIGLDLAMATGGKSINLAGGLPLVIDSNVVGAIGVSSGTDDQDLAVAEAARDAFVRILAP